MADIHLLDLTRKGEMTFADGLRDLARAIDAGDVGPIERAIVCMETSERTVQVIGIGPETTRDIVRSIGLVSLCLDLLHRLHGVDLAERLSRPPTPPA